MAETAKKEKRYRRHKRVRAKIKGTSSVPRLCVFRSSKHIYAQLIDDEKGKTILNSSDSEIKKPKNIKAKSKASPQQKTEKKDNKEKIRTRKVEMAFEVGRLIARKAIDKKIEKAVFDRGGYKYHGRVKAVAEGAREEGLRL